MLNVAIFFVFLLIWVLPPFLKQEKQGMPAKKWFLFPVLTMATLGFIVVVVLQILLGYLFKTLSPGYVADCFLEAFIGAAVVEETCKFFAGRIYLKHSKAYRKIDYIFIFAAAGIGYEIIESLAGLDGGGVIGGIIRGVFAIHVFWQMYMGAHYYEYIKAKKEGKRSASRKELCKAFIVPVLLHGLNDVGLFFLDPVVSQDAENISDTADALLAAGMFIFVLSLILNIIFMVTTLKTVYRTAKESRITESKISC